MGQLKKLLENLSIGQRIAIAAAALAVFGGLYAFAHWKHESDFRPLYTSMSAEDAGTVVQKIKESGVEYRLSENGGTVLVPSARLAELRLQLAATGLPKSGRMGFELFDKMNFGATEFVEKVNYRRALEGELERSVMSLREIEQARVHLTFPKDSVFLEAQQPAKASIVVRLKPGARVSASNVTAICNLAAGAVEGLAPEAVSVVDTDGNVLSRPRKSAAADGGPAADEFLEFRQKVERDLVAKIDAALEPLLGADRFRASASVDCDLSSNEQSEETFDPAKSVMLTSQRTEEGTTTGGGAAGVPGTASNLPRPTPRPGASAAGLTRVTEDITYQASKVTRHTRMPQGAIKRMSLSVLVDQSARWEGKRLVLVPPSPETIKSIRDLVAAATGLTPERGDQLIVETLPFESTLHQEPPLAPKPAPKPAPFSWRTLPVAVTAGGAALLVTGLLAAAALWGRRRRIEVQSPPALDAGAQKELQAREENSRRAVEDAERSRKLAPVSSKDAQQLAVVVRELVGKDSLGASNVIRTWLHENTN